MHILMLLDTDFPPDVRVENEAQSLLNAGHQVHILCYNFGKQNDFEVVKGIQVHRFAIHEQVAKKMLGLIHRLPIFTRIWRKQINNLLKTNSFDAIHIHDLPLCSLLHYLKHKTGLPIMADMHENYPYLVAEQPYMNSTFGKLLLSKKIWFKKEKEWLSYADHIICVAEEMKTRLQQVLGQQAPLVVVPNTLNFKNFLAVQAPQQGLAERFKDKFVVSFIGGIDAVRGVDLLIRAAAELQSTMPQLHILIVGDGQNLTGIKQLAQELNISNAVSFEGWKPSNTLQSYIEASQVCVIPHIRSEQTDNSSPNKLFQYMYFGKPVISSNCTSIEKIITEENCGLIFTDRNSHHLAEQIKTLYTQPALCLQLGENGRNAVLKKYNWEATCRELLGIYG